MTHDELLAKMKELSRTFAYESNLNFESALRAVVELHKPDKEGLCAMNCVVVDDDGYAWTQQQYPCDTIRTIENELNG